MVQFYPRNHLASVHAVLIAQKISIPTTAYISQFQSDCMANPKVDMILHVDASCHFVSETIWELIFKKATDCSHSLPVRLSLATISRGTVRWLHRKQNLIKAGKTVYQAQCGIISTLKLARAYFCSYIGKPSLTIYIF